MENFPITENSLNTTIIEYLTREISYLNRKNDNLFKLLNTMQSNLNYASDFIKNTYELSGNFVANMKVVAFDSSNNIISYACTDASGMFIPSVNYDMSMILLDASHNIIHKKKIGLKNTIIPTEEHIRDIDEDDIDRRFNWGFHHHPHFPFYPHPYYPYYPYPYPYPFLNNEDDFYNRDISLNHPPIHTPNYPISPPHYKPPVIHRDVLNNMIDIDSSNELNKSIENYYLNPMHKSNNKHQNQNQKPNNPLHRYTKK